MATAAFTFSRVSSRAIGFRTARPLESVGPTSGTWILTTSSTFGMVMTTLHFGHGPCLPANFSLT